MSSSALWMFLVGSGDAVFDSLSLCIANLTSEGLLTSWSLVTGLSPFPFRRTSFDQIDLILFLIPFRRGGYMISRRAFAPGSADSPHVEILSVHDQVGFGAWAPPSVNVEAWKALSVNI